MYLPTPPPSVRKKGLFTSVRDRHMEYYEDEFGFQNAEEKAEGTAEHCETESDSNDEQQDSGIWRRSKRARATSSTSTTTEAEKSPSPTRAPKKIPTKRSRTDPNPHSKKTSDPLPEKKRLGMFASRAADADADAHPPKSQGRKINGEETSAEPVMRRRSARNLAPTNQEPQTGGAKRRKRQKRTTTMGETSEEPAMRRRSARNLAPTHQEPQTGGAKKGQKKKRKTASREGFKGAGRKAMVVIDNSHIDFGAYRRFE
jgi:hypothetical protein